MMLGYVEYYVTDETAAKGGGGGMRFDAASLFKRVDRNGDGKISREEFDAFVKNLPQWKDSAKAKKLWESLDANNDGAITPEEFKRLGGRQGSRDK
jgi:Ca2+-binding EF-hand superfamily protein